MATGRAEAQPAPPASSTSRIRSPSRCPIYPGDPEPRIFTATTVADDGYNLSHVQIGTQTGTHIDAPFHFRDEGATVDRMPLELTVGPAVVVPRAGQSAGRAHHARRS